MNDGMGQWIGYDGYRQAERRGFEPGEWVNRLGRGWLQNAGGLGYLRLTAAGGMGK